MKNGEQTESIENFAFDGDDVFKDFMEAEEVTTSTKAPSSTKLGASNRTVDPVFGDDDEEEDTGKKTKIGGDDKTPPKKEKEVAPVVKAKPKAAAATQRQEEEDDTESGFTFDFSEPTQAAPKPISKTKPKGEEKEDEGKAGEEEGEEREEEGTNEEQGVEVGEEFYSNLALDLKEMGTFQAVEIPKDKNLTAEEFLDLHEQEIEARTQEAIEAFAEGIDDDGKQFLKFIKNGGKTYDFVRHYLAPTFTLKDFDEDNKDHVGKVIDHYLKAVEGLEGEDLADRKEWLKNGGKEKKFAKQYYETIQRADTQRKAAIQKNLEAQAVQEDEDARLFNEALIETISTMKGVGDFTLSEADKKEIPAYMIKPTIKVAKNKYVPRFHAELGRVLKAATPQDKERYIILAKIFASGFKIPNLKTALETKVTKEAKLRIRKTSPIGTTGSSARKKSLADMFEEG